MPAAAPHFFRMMYLLILDSLGNSELLLILVAALIFFGPRRLPQLGRQLGRSLAEFRRASEDFKRTWEREVNLDSFEKGLAPESSFLSNASEKIRAAREAAARELNPFEPEKPVAPAIAPAEAELVEPRSSSSQSEPPAQPEQPKHEWL
jgi:Tat protein translocase TatB subunit